MADKNIYTVVVADDEDELREAVCTMIPWEALGFHLVGNASNGLDALELVERLEPDLLLTDIRMPFISGIELARQVREIRPAMHIAFLSGFDDFEYAKQAIQYNIISYMLKPLTMDGLAAELKAIHEKIDARYAGLRRADSAHADRAALIIPLVLARYENAPENLETRLRRWTMRPGLPSWWSRVPTNICGISYFIAAGVPWLCCWATPLTLMNTCTFWPMRSASWRTVPWDAVPASASAVNLPDSAT